MKKKIFIAHGHNTLAIYELKSFLERLNLHPVILFELDDLGLTIIEKFEHYAKDCCFACILLTPDDKTSKELFGNEIWRARQNVILELGWFMSYLGRRNVLIIHKGEVEIPSDILGVLYLQFKNSIFEVSEKIRLRLTGANILK